MGNQNGTQHRAKPDVKNGVKNTVEEPDVCLKVEEINKRSLAKLILKVVGNEGAENNETESILRRQVQTCISNIPNHKAGVWRNSRVMFIDSGGHEYVIESGRGGTRFMVHLDGNDEINFVKLK